VLVLLPLLLLLLLLPPFLSRLPLLLPLLMLVAVTGPASMSVGGKSSISKLGPLKPKSARVAEASGTFINDARRCAWPFFGERRIKRKK
jgi:hypothetical protein